MATNITAYCKTMDNVIIYPDASGVGFMMVNQWICYGDFYRGEPVAVSHLPMIGFG